MGKANDFDLYVFDAGSNKEYTDDSEIIPRSSSVVVKRRPAARPGKGKASMYIAGAGNIVPTSEPVSRAGPTWHKGAMSKRFDVKEEPPAAPKPPAVLPQPATADDEEDAAMAAMFQAQSANWEEAQEKMSHAQRIYSGGPARGTGFSRGGKPYTPYQAPQIDRPLPPSYVCYRCGKKGHWIQECPTNNDREFDNRPRIKRTTGIPRSMLKAVDNPTEVGQGVMVTPDGGYVVAQPDLASWQKQVARPKGLTAAEVRERVPSDSTLACPIDHKLFRDAVKTPCCGSNYCEECIQTHLLERDFECPNCAKKIASLDKLTIDKPMRTKVLDYIEKIIEESRKENGDETDSSTAQDTNNGADESYDGSMDMSKMMNETIPQLQAQIAQLSSVLQGTSLPNHVRRNTEMQYQQLAMQLAQMQELVAFVQMQGGMQQMQGGGVSAAAMMQMGGFNMGQWNGSGFGQQQQGGQYANNNNNRNNVRRPLKRDRPADFLDVSGENEAKMGRYM